MSEAAHVSYRLDDGRKAVVTLDNESKHNRVGTPEIVRMIEILDEVAADRQIRVLVLTGAGRRTFSAGFNLKEMQAASPDGMGEVPWPNMLEKLRAMPMPTIAALNGNCYGGGAHLALACDFRIGVSGLELRIPAARIGLVYQPSGIKRMTELLGASFAMRALVAGETFTAQALRDAGFLDTLVEPAEFEGAVDVLADDLCAMAPLAVRAMKAIIGAVSAGTYSEAEAKRLQQASHDSDDFAEGLAALAQKRQPDFRGN